VADSGGAVGADQIAPRVEAPVPPATDRCGIGPGQCPEPPGGRREFPRFSLLRFSLQRLVTGSEEEEEA
jgi:hypothetical protein